MKIILIPNGGLGNRMRAIDSAVNLSEQRNFQLTIVWHRDSEMISRWGEVFQPIEFVKDRQMGKGLNYLLKHHENRWWLKAGMAVMEKLHICRLMDAFDGSIDYTPILSRKYLVLIIRSCIAFWPSDGFHNELFVIKDHDRLERELRKVDSNTIGVHIRRTDNLLSIQHSPLKLFEKRMEMELQVDPKVRFYLCSDDETVRDHFKSAKWEGKISMPNDTVDRNTVVGVVQGACEMKSLAACQKIYGSYWSSFGGVAARMGGIEIITVSDLN